MYLTYKSGKKWLNEHTSELFALTTPTKKIVLCPSYDLLAHALDAVPLNSTLLLGSQDCSGEDRGAFTGQIAASSLKELGCSYCIIGHYETRTAYRLTDRDIAKKIEQCLDQKIMPILCIGENQHEFSAQKASSIILQHLQVLKNFSSSTLGIAYEPIWSIGTGITPSVDHIDFVLKTILDYTQSLSISPFLLYGGSVSAATTFFLKEIPLLDGFLIGKASIDFQELKNIVLSIE